MINLTHANFAADSIIFEPRSTDTRRSHVTPHIKFVSKFPVDEDQPYFRFPFSPFDNLLHHFLEQLTRFTSHSIRRIFSCPFSTNPIIFSLYIRTGRRSAGVLFSRRKRHLPLINHGALNGCLPQTIKIPYILLISV